MSSGRMRHMSPRLALAVGAPLLLLLALAWPLLFSNSTFNEDWMNHLWYVWHQSLTIRADHLPSLFINYSHGSLSRLCVLRRHSLRLGWRALLLLALGDAPMLCDR